MPLVLVERGDSLGQAIEFASEQGDEDLWEDLLTYSETRPGGCLLIRPDPTQPDATDFTRALLEHVGAEINPIRLISRIRDGLEIPGLKPALVKILQASNLQAGSRRARNKSVTDDRAGVFAGRMSADPRPGLLGSIRGAPGRADRLDSRIR